MLTLSITSRQLSLVLPLRAVGLRDLPLVGGKTASLGEMIQHLTPQGIRIPDGFAITATGYRHFLTEAGLGEPLREIFADLKVEDVVNLQVRGEQARNLLLDTPLPADLVAAIGAGYRQLEAQYGPGLAVAVRSSATAEDLPDASFAGQQDSYLNIRGEQALLVACQRCFASLFNDRAIAYRAERGFDHLEVALAICVQKMVPSAAAGVMFSLDPQSGLRSVVLINAAYGLGENVVQGTVNPDEYVVFKPTLHQGYRPVLRKHLGQKHLQMVYEKDQGTDNRPVSLGQQQQYCLNDEEILQLARWACVIEDYYSQLHGTPTPMDMEWAKDENTGEIFIVQARPETVQSQQPHHQLHQYQLSQHPAPLLSGQGVGQGVGQGQVRVITTADLDQFQPGEVLVTTRTDPDWEPIMKRAAAIVTDQGGRTCHAAIIARELGIPAIVGTETATQSLTNGQAVTVSCAEGETGYVYPGLVPFTHETLTLNDLPPTRTQLLLNVGNPAEAFALARLPTDGVGLTRLEFIIANQIQAHPLALLYPERLNPADQARIEQLTVGYLDKAQYFVEKLTRGVGTIAAAFYPRPVVVRLSDFKSNEYARLVGGAVFEPQEENPMLGWRGAARYLDPRYEAAFALECQALRQVRETLGLTNVIVMVPFCRTPAEGRAVLAAMARHGLQQGQNGLQVYVMAELPSNIVLADQFCAIFDGFSIGSNDLTQLTLGLDRDSSLVAHLFDERNEAIQRMVQHLIQTAHAHGRKVGICGQAPSDYPEFARFLVDHQIDSLSLNADSLLKTKLLVAQQEEIPH
ncbi:phosphoenolpyruvate synthase [Candidatus Cyanaurora vandensis]|uniref:phosphoenolpyruvate synthase n=1 Tax=Candidatus Cyanaurora vandensis TaxID=2714958 RepID=UPI00257CD8BE|nr:phosphoenolpyruvate synthase [Candidatus Cyanaurora vandensis]